MCPNQSRAILIFPITPTTTWLFAGYPYTTETQKAAKVSNKTSFFNWVHSPHTELMNASHSTKSFTNSCDRISTNSKILLHSHKPQHPTIPLFSLTKGYHSKRQFSKSFRAVIQPLSTRLIKPNFCSLSHSMIRGDKCTEKLATPGYSKNPRVNIAHTSNH